MTSPAPSLDDLFFGWLYDRVSPARGSPSGYTTICSLMHNIIFDASVPNDFNRGADGRGLRFDFLAVHDLPATYYQEWTDLNATWFEVIVALCDRADFIVHIGPDHWFGIFLENLNLAQFRDGQFRSRDVPRVKRILQRLNNRSYTPSGKGGLFPLKIPNRDQRTVEIWYQMAAYMTENEMY